MPRFYSICFAILCLSVSSSLMAQDSELWCHYAGAAGQVGSGKNVVLIAADDEYRSEEALPMLGKILAKRHGFNCSVLFPVNKEGFVQPDFQENIPGMHLIASADLLIVGLRFRNLPDEQMQYFVDYLESGKPLIGFRTSTHAFRIPEDRKYTKFSFNSKVDGWEGGFGQKVLGDTWVAHHGRHGKESTRAVANPQHASHPILKGVSDVWGDSDVYTIKRLPKSATVLLDGQVLAGMQPDSKPVDTDKNNPMMPVAWIKDHQTASGKAGRIFCTTMGAATDFQSTDLRRLMLNASLWCLEMEDSIQAESDMSYVEPYEPTKFGFKSYQQGRKPSFYRLK